MTSTFKTLLLFALAVPTMGFMTDSASAQSFLCNSLSSSRRACSQTPRYIPRYIPGHYEVIRERVRIPGATYRVYVPASFQSCCPGSFSHNGSKYRPGRYELRKKPDRYEYRNRRVWVPGRYSY